MRRRSLLLVIACGVLATSIRLNAHPTPFSYIDVRLTSNGTTVAISAHIIDVAHELGLAAPERLLVTPLPPEVRLLVALMEARARLLIDGRPLACEPDVDVAPMTSTESVRWSLTCDGMTGPTFVEVTGPLFPYDSEHQTFVTVYRDGALAASLVLDEDHRTASADLGTPSRVATLQRFFVVGIEHILAGPDHLLFLVGLMLAGGTIRRLVLIVTAFTLAHSATIALSVLDLLAPPAWVIEPLIALSVVYVGLRNFRPTAGRDWRPTTAGAFGLVHGFGFAYALREIGLPAGQRAWSLLWFNLGVEAGQVAVVLILVVGFALLRRGLPDRSLTRAGAVIVTGAGILWLIERILALA